MSGSRVGERAGEFWKPVFKLLEGVFEVWLLNAAHSKAAPGRKTDVKDAQWIAELLANGLVRPRFIPFHSVSFRPVRSESDAI